MPTARVRGLRLDFATAGDPDGRPLLLINGLGGQRIAWPPELVDGLVDRGHHVIAFDNRDAGRSTILAEAEQVSRARLAAALRGDAPDPPYTLTDMAADAAGLLDHLGIAAAHVVGASMGGMIAQRLAISRPGRVATLTSMMSTTGATDVGRPTDEAREVLLTAPPAERGPAIDQAVASARVIAGPRFDPARARRRAAAAFDRGLHPDGTGRQLLAILADGDRTPQLRELDVPTLVIHGAADPLIDVSGGRATAGAVPAAELVVVEDMGHDLPVAVLDTIIDAIASHTSRGSEQRERR